ncbi:RagB/SusD family nutrient uptake outer membrane protein [Sphingobacterium pedocola]|uniref:RagB/SusD family nutrient uptake outer membrane protein n=1 Tax=Sphingobacterium pedocola TaxID=2082722 RepID=A0ABR9T773_9SPHI|nr:RagB/SusD family nutrient uptake outer membrane protein [Sphingobacterium pedocola]MBE8721199.1 RagB/SusD family nutrient uptake outer membrane protein [Sphingobacterium pedocola]
MKIIIYIIMAASLLALVSCSKFLDKMPDDALTLEMVFDDRQRTEEWLAGIYNKVPDPLMDYTRQWGCTFMSDDAQIAIAMGQFNEYWEWIVANIQGGVNPTLRPPIDIWANAYKDVRSAYLFMELAKPIENQGQTAAMVQQMKMEARFLVAFYYHKMFEIYGAFPLITSLADVDAAPEALMIPRTPVDNIVSWLDNEYRALAEFFPAVYPNADQMFGRPNKGICMALRARLLLYAASPLYNGNEDYADVKNPDGTVLFPQVYDETKWNNATSATRDFLDLAEEGHYSLYTETFPNGRIDPFLSFQNLFLKAGNVNKEIVFGRSGSNRNWYNSIGNPRGFVGGSGYYGSTQNLVDAFFMKNGLSPITGYQANGEPMINPSSGYTETGFSTEATIYPNTKYNLGGSTRTDGLVSDAGTYNMYVNREPRFYVTLWHDNQWIPRAARKTQFKSGGLDGGPTHDSPQSGYLTRKGVNPEADPRNNSVPYQPAILLRLGEFYLNYAEALNESNPGHPDILRYVNLIRERAGIPTYGPGVDQISVQTDRETMREIIRKEKRVEFAIEGDVRYNDIRRWKIAEDIFKTPIYGMNRASSTNSFYQRTPYMTRAFSKRNYLWPIYQNYMDNNINLVQNKYW